MKSLLSKIVLVAVIGTIFIISSCDGTIDGDGDFCGGIAGFQCQEGLTCVLDGDYPDAGGTCQLIEGIGEFCGGIEGVICNEGLTCVYFGDYPDAGGSCELIPPKTEGEEVFGEVSGTQKDGNIE